MPTRRKNASTSTKPNDKINADEMSAPSTDEQEALDPFQPVILDVNSAHTSIAGLAAELRHYVDTESPSAASDFLRQFAIRLMLATTALGDSIAPANEVVAPQTMTTIDPATADSPDPVEREHLDEPAERGSVESR